MSLPAVRFIGEIIPEKGLEKVVTYKYHPSTEMKEQILTDVKKHLKCDDLDDYTTELNIEVHLKQYKKPTNDTKNSGI